MHKLMAVETFRFTNTLQIYRKHTCVKVYVLYDSTGVYMGQTRIVTNQYVNEHFSLIITVFASPRCLPPSLS